VWLARPTAAIALAVASACICHSVRSAAASDGCTAGAAAAAAFGPDAKAEAALQLVQVAAGARRSRGATTPASAPATPGAGAPADVEEQAEAPHLFNGAWNCNMTAYNGIKWVSVGRSDVTIRHSCGTWKGVVANNNITVIDPPWVAGTSCWLVHPKLRCNTGDICTRLDVQAEPSKAPAFGPHFVGTWIFEDAPENSFNISQLDDDLFLFSANDNISGILRPVNGYLQADLCSGGVLNGVSARMKLSKSHRNGGRSTSTQRVAQTKEVSLGCWSPRP